MAQKPTHTSHITERPPVVVVMGHVDHGKSSLLDYIRHTNVVSGEAGGITQHVAAYEVVHEGKEGKKRITFIDTPGHAAFTAIRSRGANVADIAILVVSAEDGVKEQTLEVLKSIQDSETPYVVAINKIDKPNADIERTKVTLMEHNVFLEGLGGDVPWVPISAKTGQGIPDLLTTVLLLAEIEELTGDENAPAEGFVIEANRDSRRGIAATLIITNGSLKIGNAIRASTAIAPLRILEDTMGKKLKSAEMSSPIVVVGFDELPLAGTSFVTHNNKRDAEEARSAFVRARGRVVPQAVAAQGTKHIIPIIIKADAAGSLEALLQACGALATEYAAITVIQSGIGPVSENDTKSSLASGSATIIAFNVTTDKNALEAARQHSIPIETFDIIYKLVERLEAIIKNRTPKRSVEKVLGTIKLLKHFSKQKELQVVGGRVEEGTLAKKANLKVSRRGVVLGYAKVVNLQSHKQNVERVDAGGEFGAQLEAVFEMAPGDTLESIQTVEE
jgi:translation initiation factor IF-2